MCFKCICYTLFQHFLFDSLTSVPLAAVLNVYGTWVCACVLRFMWTKWLYAWCKKNHLFWILKLTVGGVSMKLPYSILDLGQVWHAWDV